jgi:prevent-host-death family protein
MRKIGLFEAKQKLSELVERAARGERIGITRRGKLVASIGPAPTEKVDLRLVFEEFEKIRKRSKKISGVTAKSLIEEGRR